MPCRPKLCQQFAAQLSHPPPTLFGSNHIWISDELLSEAFNRYVRVSHASRRYGSNVPGPLEARKRAAKRRMGCAVAASNMGPPGGDFGALFGGGNGGNKVENGWSWTAPGSQPAPRKEAVDVWGWGAKKPKQLAEWEQPLEIPRPGKELVEESRIAFDALLQDAQHIGTLDKPDIAILSGFLTSSADEPAAKNLSRLIEWLPGRSVSNLAWEAITALIRDKIKLVSIDNEELLEIIRGLPRVLDWQRDDLARWRLHGIYASFSRCLDGRQLSDSLIYQALFEEVHKTTLDKQACSGLLSMLTKTMNNFANAELLAENVSLTFLAIRSHAGTNLARTGLISQLSVILAHTPPDAILELLTLSTRRILEHGQPAHRFMRPRAVKWLKCLGQSSLAGHMSLVYAELSHKLRPSQLAEHFASEHFKSYDVAMAMLCDWLPNTDLQNSTALRLSSDGAASGIKALKQMSHNLRELAAADFATVAQEFGRLHEQTKQDKPWDLTWKVLLQAFVRTGVTYKPILSDVLYICKARYPSKSLFAMFVDILNCPGIPLPNHVSTILIEHFMARGENLLALKMFRADPSVAITSVPKLPMTLFEDRSIKFNLFSVLFRHTDSNPMHSRELLKCSVTPELIDLVHVTAHSIANTEVLKTSSAYRKVWSFYRWLQDRGAPLQSLISRAMVTAGILRPLKFHIWIPDGRLDYILGIVEKVEGVEMREQVERLALHMRDTVHDKVLAARSAKEQNAWSNQSTQMAKSTHFRLKQWTKKKPLRTADRRSWYVPTNDKELSEFGATNEGIAQQEQTREAKMLALDGSEMGINAAFSRALAEKAASQSPGRTTESNGLASRQDGELEDAFTSAFSKKTALPPTGRATELEAMLSDPPIARPVEPSVGVWRPAVLEEKPSQKMQFHARPLGRMYQVKRHWGR